MGNVRAPEWHQLPSATRSDLANKKFGRDAYSGSTPLHRLGVLNTYLKLKQEGMWGEIKEVFSAGERHRPGQVEFIVWNPQRLRRNLETRDDFTDPAPDGKTNWHSRESGNRCTLHFKQFTSTKDHVHVHVDKFGLRWWDPVGAIQHLIYDWAPKDFGFSDTSDVSNMLRQQQLDWRKPVTSQAPPRIQSFPSTRVAGTGEVAGSKINVPGRTPFRFETRPIIHTGAAATGTKFPKLQITANPRQPHVPGRFGKRWNQDARWPKSFTKKPQAYDFSVQELPGSIRTGPGGRIEFPGVQVTAHPRPNLLRDLGDHLERTTTPQPHSRFDWSVQTLSPNKSLGLGSKVPSLQFTAEPRSNLLRELGDKLQTTPDRYRFTTYQEPGRLRPRPGGGIEFPPMHVVAHPERPNVLQQLGRHLDRYPGSSFARH